MSATTVETTRTCPSWCRGEHEGERDACLSADVEVAGPFGPFRIGLGKADDGKVWVDLDGFAASVETAEAVVAAVQGAIKQARA